MGQTFNVVLTLVAAYVAFGGLLFDRIAASPIPADARSVIQRNLDTDVEATALCSIRKCQVGARGWNQPRQAGTELEADRCS